MMLVGMVRFVIQFVLGSSAQSQSLVIIPLCGEGWKASVSLQSRQTVACRLQLLLWFVIIILRFFSGQNYFLTIKVRKCKLRGLSHYMFDVKALREKVSEVKLAIHLELEPL